MSLNKIGRVFEIIRFKIAGIEPFPDLRRAENAQNQGQSSMEREKSNEFGPFDRLPTSGGDIKFRENSAPSGRGGGRTEIPLAPVYFSTTPVSP
jgi:hypothetical protein